MTHLSRVFLRSGRTVIGYVERYGWRTLRLRDVDSDTITVERAAIDYVETGPALTEGYERAKKRMEEAGQPRPALTEAEMRQMLDEVGP